MKPFRFGIARSRAESAAEWAAFVRSAEDRGYDVLLVADHLGALAPHVALAAAAEATERIRLGSFVLNNDFRNPALVAQEAATLDLLSEGRYELGLGAGWNLPEYEAAGIRYDRGSVRIARLEESVTVICRLLAGETVTFEGEHYTLQDAKPEPLGVQPGGPPLHIGGGGDKVLAVAARHADIVGITGFQLRRGGSPPELTHWSRAGFIDRVEHVKHEAGGRFGDLEISVLVQRVTIAGDATAAATDAAAQFTDQRVDAATLLDSPFVLVGPVDKIVDQLTALREETGASYFTVFDGRAEGFDAVVNRLAGT